MAQEVANTLAKCSTLVHPGSDVRTLKPRGASTAQGVTRSIIKEDLGSGSSLSPEVQYETVIQGTWSKDNGNNLPEAAEFITEANLGGGSERREQDLKDSADFQSSPCSEAEVELPSSGGAKQSEAWRIFFLARSGAGGVSWR